MIVIEEIINRNVEVVDVSMVVPETTLETTLGNLDLVLKVEGLVWSNTVAICSSSVCIIL